VRIAPQRRRTRVSAITAGTSGAIAREPDVDFDQWIPRNRARTARTRTPVLGALSAIVKQGKP
jgi:hypothetical protein